MGASLRIACGVSSPRTRGRRTGYGVRTPRTRIAEVKRLKLTGYGVRLNELALRGGVAGGQSQFTSITPLAAYGSLA